MNSFENVINGYLDKKTALEDEKKQNETYTENITLARKDVLKKFEKELLEAKTELENKGLEAELDTKEDGILFLGIRDLSFSSHYSDIRFYENLGEDDAIYCTVICTNSEESTETIYKIDVNSNIYTNNNIGWKDGNSLNYKDEVAKQLKLALSYLLK